MATKKKPVELRRYECVRDTNWGGFINVRMTDDMTAAFEDWYDKQKHVVDSVLTDILADGMKLSVVYDAENQCVIVSFVGALTHAGGDRYSVSSRAATIAEATALMVWKHCFVARGEYGDFRPRDGGGFSWG